MTEETFLVFSAALELCTGEAIAMGFKISSRDQSCACPLGCLPSAANNRPAAGAHEVTFDGISSGELIDFTNTFDGDVHGISSPMATLAREYRVRFP